MTASSQSLQVAVKRAGLPPFYDAIDAIDLEMRETAYRKEQGEKYLAELPVSTQQLRACKQLKVCSASANSATSRLRQNDGWRTQCGSWRRNDYYW
jgi:hypothetical protein